LGVVLLQSETEFDHALLDLPDQPREPFLDGVSEGCLEEWGGQGIDEEGEVLEVVLDQEAGHINEVHPLLNSLQQFW
jgi:hypothetical protein